MQLKEFSLIAPVIESADVFAALETVIPPDMIEQTLGNTESFEELPRKLPSQLVVCLGKRDESYNKSPQYEMYPDTTQTVFDAPPTTLEGSARFEKVFPSSVSQDFWSNAVITPDYFVDPMAAVTGDGCHFFCGSATGQ